MGLLDDRRARDKAAKDARTWKAAAAGQHQIVAMMSGVRQRGVLQPSIIGAGQRLDPVEGGASPHAVTVQGAGTFGPANTPVTFTDRLPFPPAWQFPTDLPSTALVLPQSGVWRADVQVEWDHTYDGDMGSPDSVLPYAAGGTVVLAVDGTPQWQDSLDYGRTFARTFSLGLQQLGAQVQVRLATSGADSIPARVTLSVDLPDPLGTGPVQPPPTPGVDFRGAEATGKTYTEVNPSEVVAKIPDTAAVGDLLLFSYSGVNAFDSSGGVVIPSGLTQLAAYSTSARHQHYIGYRFATADDISGANTYLFLSTANQHSHGVSVGVFAGVSSVGSPTVETQAAGSPDLLITAPSEALIVALSSFYQEGGQRSMTPLYLSGEATELWQGSNKGGRPGGSTLFGVATAAGGTVGHGWTPLNLVNSDRHTVVAVPVT